MMNYYDDETVRQFFQKFARSFMSVQKRGVEKWGITAIQGHILYELNNHPEIPLNRLSAILQFDKGFISRQVDHLVKLNMVERHQDAKDRRYIKLFLTDQGRVKQAEVSKFMQNYLDTIIGEIPLEKQNQVIESLELLLISLSKYNKQEGE